MLPRKHKKLKLVIRLFSCLLIVGVAVLLYFFRQTIIDQIIVWQFKPASGVVTLIERAGMNDYGKFIYLASEPQLDQATDFNKACDRVENTASILGCYNNNIIYLYNVTDTQLDGIREVTAAHETLHAAYARLGESEKTKLNTLLEYEYKKLENNANFKSLMDFYDRTEPGQRDNELHSVIGTEVSDISPELESYYSKYFSDRKKVVALDNKYSKVFNDLSEKATELATKLNALVVAITTDTDEYNADAKTLNSDILTFNKRAENGTFDSMTQFYSERSALTSRITALNTLRDNVVSNKTQYDSLLTEYNSISSQSKKLYNSIDSTLVSSPSVDLQ